MNDNLQIWDRVFKTDPQHTKQVNQRGGFTSVSPQYQTREATKVFGPYGWGWGFSKISIDTALMEETGLVLVSADFFYRMDDEVVTFPINNAWAAKTVKNGVARYDPDFAKKAETNTMSKALSKLGFSGDIFMGEFDDHQYVDNARREFDLENAENKIEEAAKQEAEHLAWIDKSIQIIEEAVSLDALKTIYTSLVRKANLRGDKSVLIRFEKAKNTAKTRLES